MDWAEEDDEGDEVVTDDPQGEEETEVGEEEAEARGDTTPRETSERLAAIREEEAARWRECMCALEDELQWYRDAIDEAHRQLKLTPPSDAKALLRRLRAMRWTPRARLPKCQPPTPSSGAP